MTTLTDSKPNLLTHGASGLALAQEETLRLLLLYRAVFQSTLGRMLGLSSNGVRMRVRRLVLSGYAKKHEFAGRVYLTPTEQAARRITLPAQSALGPQSALAALATSDAAQERGFELLSDQELTKTLARLESTPGGLSLPAARRRFYLEPEGSECAGRLREVVVDFGDVTSTGTDVLKRLMSRATTTAGLSAEWTRLIEEGSLSFSILSAHDCAPLLARAKAEADVGVASEVFVSKVLAASFFEEERLAAIRVRRAERDARIHQNVQVNEECAALGWSHLSTKELKRALTARESVRGALPFPSTHSPFLPFFG